MSATEDIEKAIGKENYLKLCRLFGGCRVYIPKPESISRDTRDLDIYRQFDGGNTTQLAKRYNLSETHIRRILEKVKEQNQNGIPGACPGGLQNS